MPNYKKCVLEQPIGRFRQHKTEWVPEELAVVGSVVTQRLQREVWDKSWLIMEVLDESASTATIGWQREWKKL